MIPSKMSEYLFGRCTPRNSFENYFTRQYDLFHVSTYCAYGKELVLEDVSLAVSNATRHEHAAGAALVELNRPVVRSAR